MISLNSGGARPGSMFKLSRRLFVTPKFYEFLIFCPVIAYRTFMPGGLFQRSVETEVSMLDILFIAIGLGFLAIAMLYAVACDRL